MRTAHSPPPQRTGFEWALANSCLSHFDRKHYVSEAAWRDELRHSPVRIKWDPEQALQLQPHRRLGPSRSASPATPFLSVNEWICSIEDVTETMHCIHAPPAPIPGRRRSV